ncbi:MAG: ATP-binding protein [Victivallales bacterium]|nr:ATP-binding protein [Victivallales bacterium]
MMIARKLEKTFREALKEYPVVTVFGPRQSGKTTLAKMCCSEYAYVNLEDRETRELAMEDYKAFFLRYPPPVIIDEIQRVPELVSAVQVLVDTKREEMGRFVLTGSHQTELAAAVDQSLAGRTSVLELFPLSLEELGDGRAVSTDTLMLQGFMPELHVALKNPTRYYRNYFRTYVERDVRKLVNVRDLILFERFVTLLAGRIGQVVNFSSLAGETGVSSSTIMSWMSILQASFLIYRLPPYFSNISKRMVKSPKVYFTEPGLAAYLLGIETERQMSTHPLRGALFENMVVMEALKAFANDGRESRMAFLRTEKGFEIDLMLSYGVNVQPIEIKSTMTFNRKLIHNLETYMKEDEIAVKPTLVFDGEGIPLFGDQGVKINNIREWHPGEIWK